VISDIAPVFKMLLDTLAKADSKAFSRIILDRDFDIIDGLLAEQKALAEVLVSLDEQTSVVNLQAFGQILIGRAEVTKVWYEHWRNVITAESSTAIRATAARESE